MSTSAATSAGSADPYATGGSSETSETAGYQPQQGSGYCSAGVVYGQQSPYGYSCRTASRPRRATPSRVTPTRTLATSNRAIQGYADPNQQAAAQQAIQQYDPNQQAYVGQAGQLGGAERVAAEAAVRQGRLDAGGGFLGLQRAYRVDQPPARAQHRGGGGQQAVLGFRQGADVARALEARHVGVAADGAGGAARRVQQHGVERGGRLPFGGVGGDGLRGQPPVAQIVPQPFQARRVAVERGDLGAGGGELRGLAAGGGAQIADALAGARGEQAGGQRGGGVLHPEGALLEPGQRGDGGAGGEADGAGRQQVAALGRQGAGTQGEVQRRLVLVGERDGARLGAPGGPEPGGGVEARAVELGQRRRSGRGDAAQHGVHQAGEGVQPAGARQGDGGGDRGVRRGVEQQQAGGAEAQDVAHRVGRRLLEEWVPARRPACRAGAAWRPPAGAPPSGRAWRSAAGRRALPPAGGGGRAPRSAGRTRRRGWGLAWGIAMAGFAGSGEPRGWWWS